MFLHEKSNSFVAWICPLLLPVIFSEEEFIFFEGDDIGCIFFLSKGNTSYVLPKHNNQRYVTISEGESFGVVDIIGSAYKEDKLEINNWFSRKDLMQRQFSMMSDTYTEIMSLSV